MSMKRDFFDTFSACVDDFKMLKRCSVYRIEQRRIHIKLQPFGHAPRLFTNDPHRLGVDKVRLSAVHRDHVLAGRVIELDVLSVALFASPLGPGP